MKIKEAVYKKCKCCNHNLERLSSEVYGCDVCKKIIDMDNPGVEYLRLVVHYHDARAEYKELCSWWCVRKLIKSLVKKKATDYFISLPFLNFDTKGKGTSPKDFLKLLK